MSENNDVPPVPKLRNKISKEIETLTSATDTEVLAAATKGNTLVVFFMVNGTDVVRVHERHVRVSNASGKISKAQAERIVKFLYAQVVSDKKLMEVTEERAAISQGLLASNPYGITANDISIHGMSAKELCGREARTIGGRNAALIEVAKIMDIEVTPELIVATLHRSCPQTRGKPMPAAVQTKAKPPQIWPAVATGAAAITQPTFN
ncbi:MAG: hypothetical protein SFW65_09365 [Alphaproteobacteria bacterium]|nr:hypothetical protein [Alphaproteobacteria bacterium]